MNSTAAVEERELTQAPSLLGPYARAVLPKPKPKRGAPSATALLLRDRPVDPVRLDRYTSLCAFTGTTPHRLPVTYPHLEAFPLAMSLMARRDFPLPLLGLVHIANTVEQRRPLALDERLSYRVSTGDPFPHPKGTAVEVTAEAEDGAGRVVWHSVSTYLHRGGSGTGSGSGSGSGSPAHDDRPFSPTLDEVWSCPASLGRAYAAVSGDRNPIHLHPLTARLFGSPRHIAHGMWTKARSLSALATADLLPDAYRAEVDFRAPILLPTDVRFRADSTRFHLTGLGDSPRTHLRGTITAL